MGKPTKRRSPTKVIPKVQPPKSSPKKTEVYRPKRFALDQEQITSQNGSMPFHAMIGEGRLEPYVWINLKGDNEDLLFLQPLPHWEVSPLRKGLKKVVLKNEIGKYPTVEFEMYVPDYRDKKGLKVRDKITLFKMGANFSVKWGYRNAHTKWSNLVVYEHKIAFEEGTAVLKVKGKAGNRLSATNTNEVFTAEYGKSGIEQLASVVGMKVDYKELLEDELDQVRQAEDAIVTAGLNFGALVWTESTKYKIDFFVNPEREEIRLASPYKLDLIKRGAKAYRMTYGFPASPIASIEYTKKYPKKKRSRGSYRKGLSQEAKGGTGEISEDNTTLLKLVHGVFSKNNSIFEVGFPYTRAVFSNIEEARKAFPKEKDYEVHARDKRSQGIADVGAGEVFHIFKEVNVGKRTVESETREISKETFLELSPRSNKVIKVLSFVSEDKIKVKIWTLTDPNAVKVEKKEEVEPVTTTVTTEPEMEWVVETSANVPKRSILNESTIALNEDHDYFRSDPETYAHIVKMRNQAINHSKTNRIKVEKVDSKTSRIVLENYREKGKEKPKKESGGKSLYQQGEDRDNAPTTQDGKARGENKPSGQGNSSRKMSSGKIVTSISVKTKVGDWTLRVGRLLEIVDLYSLVDGYYSISSEEHTIDVSGFHTKVVAKKATSKTVDRYGGRAGGSPSSKTRKKGDAEPKIEKKKTAFVPKESEDLLTGNTSRLNTSFS